MSEINETNNINKQAEIQNDFVREMEKNYDHTTQEFKFKDGIDRDDFVLASIEANPEDIENNRDLFESSHPALEKEFSEGASLESFNKDYNKAMESLEQEIHDEWQERLDSENLDRDNLDMAHAGWMEYRDDIKDNPNYFDEEGNFKWPESDGFADENDLENTSSIETGREITRYGFETGHYMTDSDDKYDSLALPYKEEFMPKNTYTVKETIDDAYEGEIADLQEGDETGGGNQIWTPTDSIGELERDGKLKLHNT